MYNAGDFLEDATVYIPFNTFDSNDPSASVTITDLVAGDVEVWKDGVVQTTPGAGVTITLNIGANNGSHLIAIDTSNTTDGGFYVIGSDYQVRINGTTIDGATVNAWVGTFSTENRFKEVTVTAMSAGVIANATFNADVGSTAHGTNIIALAARKILEELNLDHLAKVTTGVAADSDLEAYCVAGTLFSHFFSVGADITTFKPSTDSPEAIRNHIGNGSNLTEAGGTGDQLTAINLPNQTMDITGSLSGSVGSLTGHTNQTADNDILLTAIAGYLTTEIAEIYAAVITNAAGADVSADVIAVKAIADAIKVVTDNMADSASTLISGVVEEGGGPTTTVFQTDLAEVTNDHFNGRIVIFLDNVLQYQATDITDYIGASGTLGVTALTEAPTAGDRFVIV